MEHTYPTTNRKNQEMTHGPIQKEQHAAMNSLARGVDAILNPEGHGKEWGFCLLVFPFGEPSDPRMNYISNGHRQDMIIALKEFIARNEGLYHETEVKQ